MESYLKVVVGIILQGDKLLIAKRPKEQHQGGLWEFPGGKVEAGESNLDALKRELKEEVNIKVKEAQLFEEIQFDYPDKSVHLLFYKVIEFTGDAKGLEGQEVRWVNLSRLNNYSFPEANNEIIKLLLSEVK